MTTKTKARVARLSADQAVQFAGVSQSSFLQVQEGLRARTLEGGDFAGCACTAYLDTFTFARWIAQGYAPRKGTHGLKIASFVPIDVKSKEEGSEGERRLRPATLVLFCRCQVEPTKQKESK